MAEEQRMPLGRNILLHQIAQLPIHTHSHRYPSGAPCGWGKGARRKSNTLKNLHVIEAAKLQPAVNPLGGDTLLPAALHQGAFCCIYGVGQGVASCLVSRRNLASAPVPGRRPDALAHHRDEMPPAQNSPGHIGGATASETKSTKSPCDPARGCPPSPIAAHKAAR